ncbi:MAG: hypothetical protein WC683_03300 [bacterium]
MNNVNSGTYQELNFFDHEVAIVALHVYRRNAVERWKWLDRLVADRACLQTQIARKLHNEGRLSDEDLKRVWAEIDEQLYAYDDALKVLYRRELLAEIDATIARLRRAARTDREQREGACHAA